MRLEWRAAMKQMACKRAAEFLGWLWKSKEFWASGTGWIRLHRMILTFVEDVGAITQNLCKKKSTQIFGVLSEEAVRLDIYRKSQRRRRHPSLWSNGARDSRYVVCLAHGEMMALERAQNSCRPPWSRTRTLA
jgi:hypothetical protein